MVKPKAESIEAAVKAVEQDNPVGQDKITLSNGIVVRIKAVPMMTLRYAVTNVKRPEPPTIMNEDKGRSEVWEGDPRYVEALAKYEEEVGDATANVMFILGTEVEHVPEGIPTHDDDSWIDTLKSAGVPVKADSPAARYLSWMRFYAVCTPKDLAILSDAIARKSGLLDKDVAASLQSFRGGTGRGADLETEAQEQRTDRDNLQSPNGGVDIGS